METCSPSTSTVTSETNEDSETEEESANLHDGAATEDDEEELSEDSALPRLWQDLYVSLIVLCLFSASGLLIMLLPYLPKQQSPHNFNIRAYIFRTFALSVLGVLSTGFSIYLIREMVRLHDSGLALWPYRCYHCTCALKLIQMEAHTIAKSKGTKFRLKRHVQSMQNKVEDISTNVNKSTLYVLYIFSLLIMCFLIIQLIAVLPCLIDIQSFPSSSQLTRTEIVANMVFCVAIVINAGLLNFAFIPNFFDVHLVAVPKLRWSLVVITGAAIWLSLMTLVKPLTYVVHSGRAVDVCYTNNTFGDILKGALDIGEPFFTEFTIMVAWILVEIWSRFLPRHAHVVMLKINRHFPPGKLSRQSTAPFKFSTSSRRTMRSTVRRAPPSNDVELRCILHASEDVDSNKLVESEQAHYGSLGSSARKGRKLARDPASQGEHRLMNCEEGTANSMRRELPKKQWRSSQIEVAVAILTIVGAIYFTISLYIMSDQQRESHSIPRLEWGRYLQWIARILFFSPELCMILKQMKMTHDPNYGYQYIRGSPYYPDDTQGGDKMLVLTVTGACFYEITNLVASICNLFNASSFSRNEVILNAVCILSACDSIIRMSLETCFLLYVQRQKLKNEREVKWTKLCLVCIVIMNSFQWMWDSLIHDVMSPVAWPVLVMFFDAQVGKLIGTLLVPLTHLYDLHTAILAFEIFKIIHYRNLV